MGKTKRSNNFLLQGGILAMAGIIVRLIGMLYRVPLTGIIGNRGNGYYSAAYEIYSMVLLVSSYSIPLALSKEMSAKIALGQYKNALPYYKTFTDKYTEQDEYLKYAQTRAGELENNGK